ETGGGGRGGFDLCWGPPIGLGQEGPGGSAGRDRPRGEKRVAGEDLLGRGHVRRGGFVWLGGPGGQAGGGQRCAHELQEFPAPRLIGFPLRRESGKFAKEEVLKHFGPGEFLEALPVTRSGAFGESGADRGEIELFELLCSHQRWQVEQLVRL